MWYPKSHHKPREASVVNRNLFHGITYMYMYIILLMMTHHQTIATTHIYKHHLHTCTCVSFIIPRHTFFHIFSLFIIHKSLRPISALADQLLSSPPTTTTGCW